MKKFLLLAGIGLIMFNACKTKNPESKVTEEPVSSDLIVNPEVLVEMNITVEGMTCTGCENTINSGVGEIAGVVHVSSSFKDGKAVVKFDSTQTDFGEISAAITQKGYIVKDYVIESPAKTGEESNPE